MQRFVIVDSPLRNPLWHQVDDVLDIRVKPDKILFEFFPIACTRPALPCLQDLTLGFAHECDDVEFRVVANGEYEEVPVFGEPAHGVAWEYPGVGKRGDGNDAAICDAAGEGWVVRDELVADLGVNPVAADYQVSRDCSGVGEVDESVVVEVLEGGSVVCSGQFFRCSNEPRLVGMSSPYVAWQHLSPQWPL